MKKLETCCLCDAPTGNAGKHDDSLYGENGDGPYCDECFMWKYGRSSLKAAPERSNNFPGYADDGTDLRDFGDR